MQLSRLRALGVSSTFLLAQTTTAAAAAFPTNMTAIKVFDNDSCSGSPLQVVFNPTQDCIDPTPDMDCSLEAQDLGIFASADCTHNPLALSAAVFQDSPYLLVELFDPDSDCQSLEGIAAFRIDSNCHPTIDVGTSFQVNWNDVMPTFQLFTDPLCSSTPMLELNVTFNNDECLGGNMMLHVVGRPTL